MEEDEMDSSLPRLNEGSLPPDKELEENLNVKVTFIKVLPIRPPSPEDSRLPAPSAPHTGSEDHQEAPSTSQGVGGVECTADRRTDVSICLIKEMLQLMSDRANMLVARPDIPGGQICRSQSAMKLLAQEMVAKITTILQSDTDVLQAVQSKAGLESVIMTIKNLVAGKTTDYQEEQRLDGEEACLEVDEIRQGRAGIMDDALISRRPEIADSIIYRCLCMEPESAQKAKDEVKMTLIFLEPQPQTSPTAQPSQADEEREQFPTQRKGTLQTALKTLSRLRQPQLVPVRASKSGANLEQARRPAKPPHSRPLLVRMFRALKKSIGKKFCCLGESDMVQQ